MENETNGDQTTAPGLGVASSYNSPKSSGPWIIISLIIGLILIGGAIFAFTKLRSSEPELSPTPTSFEESTEPEPTEEPSPSPSVDREDVSIEVQNGTGITGEAGFLQTKLKDLGYTDIKIGNSSRQDYVKAKVTFAKDVPQENQDEILKLLRDTYQGVDSSTGTPAGGVDVQIITGLRKGATPRPSATATPRPSATSTASPTPTGTATASPTPTATP